MERWKNYREDPSGGSFDEQRDGNRVSVETWGGFDLSVIHFSLVKDHRELVHTIQWRKYFRNKFNTIFLFYTLVLPFLLPAPRCSLSLQSCKTFYFRVPPHH